MLFFMNVTKSHKNWAIEFNKRRKKFTILPEVKI